MRQMSSVFQHLAPVDPVPCGTGGARLRMVAVEIRPGGSRTPARRVTRSAGHANARQRELDALDDEIAGRPSVSVVRPIRATFAMRCPDIASGMADDHAPGPFPSVTSRSGKRQVTGGLRELPQRPRTYPSASVSRRLAARRGEDGPSAAQPPTCT